MTQSNTRRGDRLIQAGIDLRGMEGCVVMLGCTQTEPHTPIVLPPATSIDAPLYVILEGAAAGELASVRPLTPARNVRLKLAYGCNPGEALIANINDGRDGTVVAFTPNGAVGTFRGIAIAEEAGTDGQLILARPAPIGLLVITG